MIILKKKNRNQNGAYRWLVYHKTSKTDFEKFWAWQMDARCDKEKGEFGVWTSGLLPTGDF